MLWNGLIIQEELRCFVDTQKTLIYQEKGFINLN